MIFPWSPKSKAKKARDEAYAALCSAIARGDTRDQHTAYERLKQATTRALKVAA